MTRPPLYYCHQCKKIFDKVEQLLFVEDGSGISFCGEKCIEKYFQAHVDYFADWEEKLRKKYKLSAQEIPDLIENHKIVEEVCSHPQEIWRQENILKEEIYTFIGSKEDPEGKIFIAIICLVFLSRPSYIFLITATRSQEFLNEMKVGEKISNMESFIRPEEHHPMVSPETQTFLENKKSSLLAFLLQKRSPADIPIEEFPRYEIFYQSTLEAPDEIYQYEDDDGDELYAYIRAHEKNGSTFYYLIIGTVWNEDPGGPGCHVLPILSFPTNDADLYHYFRRGELLSGNLKS
jgi:hypothetical protein